MNNRITRTFAPRLFAVGRIQIHPAPKRPDQWVAVFPGGDVVKRSTSFLAVVRAAKHYEALA